MGLFSFVGKALKAVSKVASFVPGIGGVVSKVAGVVGNVLDHKQPMNTATVKAQIFRSKYGGRNPMIQRGKSTLTGGLPTASVLRSTPIMPGGAVSTPSGIVASNGAAPPQSFGGGSATARRKTTKKRKKATTRRRTTTRRKSRLKFGSKAWRKKYMKRR